MAGAITICALMETKAVQSPNAITMAITMAWRSAGFIKRLTGASFLCLVVTAQRSPLAGVVPGASLERFYAARGVLCDANAHVTKIRAAMRSRFIFKTLTNFILF